MKSDLMPPSSRIDPALFRSRMDFILRRSMPDDVSIAGCIMEVLKANARAD